MKDKNFQNQSQQAKRAVVSSLLKNYIDKAGQVYAGAIDTTLRRLIKKTRIADSELLSYYADRFGSIEIEDVKSTPWGFCLLRSRHKERAKCAELGMPMRSKASPSLCLGCINNLAMTSSIEGIIMTTLNEIELLRQENHRIPKVFLDSARSTVKLALSCLRKLWADNSIVSEYKNALRARTVSS